MSSLTILNNEYKELMDLLLENDGQISQELETMLTANLIESKTKVSNYILVLSKYKNEIEFTKEQIKKAEEYISRIDAAKCKLEKIALDVVIARGSRLDGNNGNWISTRKSSSVKIIDPQAIPPDYVRIKIEPDKTAIKKAIDQGELVPGADIEVSERISYK